MIIPLMALNLVGALALFALIQAVAVAAYCRYMRPQPLPQTWPLSESCAMVMALRGADANMRHTLLAHLEQREVSYHVHWVVDSEQDPAVAVIRSLPAEYSHRWTLHVMELNSDRCSLKCLGLSQVVRRLLAEEIPPTYLAFADGDGRVSRDWLRRLLAPMVTPVEDTSAGAATKVGATTGHRWYTCFPTPPPRQESECDAGVDADPKSVSLGAIVRYFWNLGSLPQMHLFRVVWGGSWAIRSEVMRTCGLLESWEQSLYEDTQVRTYVERAGYQVVTAPGVLVKSYEPIRVAAATGWIARQLLDMRLYHPSFRFTLLHAGCLAGIHLWALILIGITTVMGDGWTLRVLMAALLGYQLVYVLVWGCLQRTAERCLSNLDFGFAGREAGTRRSWGQVVWAISGLFLTQVAYPIAAFKALFTRSVVWRGIRYRINAPTQIQRLDYQVYRSEQDVAMRSESA